MGDWFASIFEYQMSELYVLQKYKGEKLKQTY